jgi:hypothetical protein
MNIEPCPTCGGAIPCGEHAQEAPQQVAGGDHCGAFEDGCWQFIEGRCKCPCYPKTKCAFPGTIFFTQEEWINLRSVAEIAAEYASSQDQTTANEDLKRWSMFVTTFSPRVVLKLLRCINEAVDKATAWEEQSNRNLQRCEELQDQLREARKQ